MIARLCESFLTDIHMSEKVEALYKTDRSLCEKIRDFLRDIGQKIKAAFAGAKPQSELGRIGRDIAQKHSEVLDLFIEGIRRASENLAYTESGSGVLNMARDTSYDFSIEKDLDTLDEKALKVYNKRGWAYSLFDDEDMILLREKFDEYYQLKTRNKDNILPDGTMVTDINNKVLLIGGTRNSPVIHGVLLINSDAESYAEIIKDDIYDDTKEFGIHARQCTNYLANCENWYGTKTVRFYGADDYYHIKGREQARAKTPDGWNRFGYVKDYEIGRRIREEAQQSGEVKLQSRDADYLSAVEAGDMETAQRMVDEAAKAAGYDMHLYHGAKSGGGFTVFKGWQYFTANKSYAERYTKGGTGEGLYDVYVRADRLLDTRKAKDRAVFEKYRQEYGMSELQKSGLPDWTDGYDLSEIIEENDLDYDGIILDATAIQRDLAAIEKLFGISTVLADVDGDGVTILDATYIQRWLAGLSCPEGIGEPIALSTE